ncbi:cytochrome d ubiquinol oxidase subunit II [Tenacibaculum dicentrarchi]|nr:cytochrome d ubiquinol oxidase subunit II [Tenacibaculum dicentrarchi]MCD8414365.1 cytochrome d ubiquinol oxidase subunit II [Tenacibaculum dicentrarchi]MCD8418997.1 cytochrome d ubiquinol oxidase subunit II [Tenacibaculum dicentrarchi]MCD8424005.1 cytochrome d ubiquinol oxidase subunit II [Tenacibaculum dicentrarchi]MCD8436669.1 cytochrome d ubiquinol oxidase subunit II [Tenacibaculum dicentrarchi]
MEVFWFIIIAIVLAVFFILDGYDFGTGIIHLFMAKKEKDKEVIAKSAGLFWDSNEVWLVAAGGMLFMAFPTFYASVFSGFYLPLIIVLWLIIFRAIGLEFRSQFNVQMWKDIWDTSFGVSSLLLALFFGIALGNVIRGVNLGGVENGISAYEAHYFFLPLWNNSFSPLAENPGVIDWFTLVIGIIAVVTLAIHGANWIVLKTNSSINEKLKKTVFKLNISLIGLTIFSLIIWQIVNPNSLNNFIENPFLLVFPLIYISGLVGLFFVEKLNKEIYAFTFSTLLILGGITSSLASIFPVILPSTNTVNDSLTIYNTTTTAYGLSVATYWGVVGFILLFVYMIVQKKIMGGKIDNMDYGH